MRAGLPRRTWTELGWGPCTLLLTCAVESAMMIDGRKKKTREKEGGKGMGCCGLQGPVTASAASPKIT
jgi:hypothetical protein